MRGNFERCLKMLWDDIGDAPLGKPHQKGARRLGITVKTYASWKGKTLMRVDLNELNKGEAAAILDCWFWRAVHADDLPSGIDYAMFRLSVEEGPKKAVELLQVSMRVPPTGEMDGPLMRKIENSPEDDLITKICDYFDEDGIEKASHDMSKNDPGVMDL